MIKNKKGNVLSIVTTYAWTGSPYVVPSAAAKAGVLAMTRSLAVEWGKHNIRFNAIAPGPFPTEGAWSRLMPPGFDDFEDNILEPLKEKTDLITDILDN
jgi:NAD(P)-dependent dehydrogenase (short-subunit alcohol dehydrogenase family)